MFSIFGMTITLTQVIAAIPQIIQGVKTAYAVYQHLVSDGVVPEPQAWQQSLNMFGKHILGLFALDLGIPHPHPMTREEEERWFQRVNPPS